MSLAAYVQRWAGGFADSNAGKPVDAQFLNAVETALLGLLGGAPTDGQAYVYDNALGRFKTVLLTNAHIDPAAAIAKSKLAALNIADADVAAGAAIAASKLAGNIPASKLQSYPADPTQFLRGDGSWSKPALYRKTTSKQVVSSVAETDLLNGEITIGAGVLGTSGIMRLTAWGVGFNNNVATTSPLWKVTLGGTTVFQTNNTGGATDWGAFNAVRGWKLEVMIANTGVTNSQTANIHGVHSATTNGTNVRDFVVGHGTYSADNTQALFNIVGENDALAVDTTVAQALGLKVTLPVSSANTYMTLLGAVVEIL